MTKFYIFFILITIFMSFCDLIQEKPKIEWEATFGSAGLDEATGIIQTQDGGFALCATTTSQGAGKKDVWIIKLDAMGTLQWQQIYGGKNVDGATSLLQTNSGDFVICGWTSSTGNGNTDFWVLKIDPNGKIIWEKTFGGSSWDEGNCVIQGSDGNYFVCGETQSKGSGAIDAWVIKLDDNGELLWEKTFGDSLSDGANSIIQDKDNNLVLGGYTKSKGSGDEDFWIFKLDAEGNILWEKVLGGEKLDGARAITQTDDGNYIAAGYHCSKEIGGCDFGAAKISSDGELLWHKTFGGMDSDGARSIIPSSQGGCIVCGYSESQTNGMYDYRIVKLDAQGEKLYDANYGGSEMDEPFSIITTHDDGLAIAGYTYSKGKGYSDVWVVKLKK